MEVRAVPSRVQQICRDADNHVHCAGQIDDDPGPGSRAQIGASSSLETRHKQVSAWAQLARKMCLRGFEKLPVST
jgi:hypothetical protein